MKLIKDIDVSLKFVKDMIKALIDLNKYPDISIAYYPNFMHTDYRRVRAELVLCTGEIFAAEALIHKDELTDDKFKQYLEERLLDEIACKYIRRSFEKRKNGEVTEQASHYIRWYQNVEREILGEPLLCYG